MENKDNKSIKNIEIGKYYLIHDGSEKGHPGLVVWKDDDANLYLLIKFGSTGNDNNTLLPHKISEDVENNYVYKRPFLAKRKDVGKEWIFDYGINDEDKTLLDGIAYNNPTYSTNINRKDRRYFSLVIKQKQIKTVA